MMEKDPDLWHFHNISCVTNVKASPALVKLTTDSMLPPNYANLCGFCNFGPHLAPLNLTDEFALGQKRFIIFDKPNDQIATQLLNSNLKPNLRSDEINVSHVKMHEEMHEDTEEINALLYSDSENEYEYEEETDSTGHSPTENITENLNVVYKEEEEEVLQPPVSLLSKRCRVECIEISIEDTASSTNSNINESGSRKKAKIEKIQETVGVLRRIIPCCNGEDAVSVLDEAIKYLKSLRLKAKGLDETSLD